MHGMGRGKDQEEGEGCIDTFFLLGEGAEVPWEREGMNQPLISRSLIWEYVLDPLFPFVYWAP